MRSLVGVHALVVLGSIVSLGAPGSASLAPAQTSAGPGPELTIETIMRGPEFVGRSPSRLRWTPDGRSLTFVWRAPGDSAEFLYRVPRGGGTPERLSREDAERVEPWLSAVFSRDRRWAAYGRDGGVYLLDVSRGRTRLLTHEAGRVAHVQISEDGSVVYFLRELNLFRVTVGSGRVERLTDIQRGSRPTGQERVLLDQQRELFDVFRLDSLRRVQGYPPFAAEDTAIGAKPVFIREKEEVDEYAVSSDGRRVALEVTREAPARLAWVPDYVTETGYTEEAPRKRSKVGDDQETIRMGVLDLETGDVTWVDHGQGDREVELRFRGWAPDGGALLALGIAADSKDRWVLVIDPETGASRVLDHLHDDAWIGGPAWDEMGWLPEGDRVWFVSEATGFAHLYVVPRVGGEATPLTEGPWEVTEVRISDDRKRFEIQTSEASPFERHLYTTPLEGGERVRLSESEGRHDGVWSPDGRRLAVLHSAANRPPELYLQDARPGAPARRITQSTTAAFRSFTWRVPEIVTFRAQDGADVPARLYRPETPNGAAVVFVHGAGYLQNVHAWWSSYYREYMFHHILASRGYTVLDIDYRGSAGYGRDWRTGIYRHMGGADLSDQVDGARYLVGELGVDSARIGIYGGSYGGFITFMAMFTEPDVFAAGASLRPVTDWAHYNHGYTSRILNLPQDDAEAYERSSPIYFAEGLKGALLICHGMVDQNVHFQDTVRLVQRLIELGKTNWEVAIYPVEDHGFRHASSWTDEYRRILRLFEENLGG
ncbi:MAG: prolyl oligopeptidase family serine peptidase [Gemmatimonadota bacterium]